MISKPVEGFFGGMRMAEESRMNEARRGAMEDQGKVTKAQLAQMQQQQAEHEADLAAKGMGTEELAGGYKYPLGSDMDPAARMMSPAIRMEKERRDLAKTQSDLLAAQKTALGQQNWITGEDIQGRKATKSLMGFLTPAPQSAPQTAGKAAESAGVAGPINAVLNQPAKQYAMPTSMANIDPELRKKMLAAGYSDGDIATAIGQMVNQQTMAKLTNYTVGKQHPMAETMNKLTEGAGAYGNAATTLSDAVNRLRTAPVTGKDREQAITDIKISLTGLGFPQLGEEIEGQSLGALGSPSSLGHGLWEQQHTLAMRHARTALTSRLAELKNQHSSLSKSLESNPEQKAVIEDQIMRVQNAIGGLGQMGAGRPGPQSISNALRGMTFGNNQPATKTKTKSAGSSGGWGT
jgi:hypothetical protein